MESSKLKKYVALKKKVEQAQQEASRAEGALEHIMKQLAKEFDCNTLEEATKKLRLLEKQEQRAKVEFEKAVEKFEKKWEIEIE